MFILYYLYSNIWAGCQRSHWPRDKSDPEGRSGCFSWQFSDPCRNRTAGSLFKLVACFIHAFILLQFCPTVKSVTGDFFRIRLICLGSTQRIITKILDKDGIYSTDKDAGIREPGSNRLIVSASVLHAGFGFVVQAFDLLNEGVDSGLGVWNIAGRHKKYQQRS